MTLFDDLNTQLNRERMNAAQYAAFAANLEAANWSGFASWMRHASADELVHASKFEGYLIDRNVTPVYDALDKPMALDGNQPIPFFEAALKLEQANTQSILVLDSEAESEDDAQTETWLIWAIEEQTRSERELVDALLELRRVDVTGLMILDDRYGEK